MGKPRRGVVYVVFEADGARRRADFGPYLAVQVGKEGRLSVVTPDGLGPHPLAALDAAGWLVHGGPGEAGPPYETVRVLGEKDWARDRGQWSAQGVRDEGQLG